MTTAEWLEKELDRCEMYVLSHEELCELLEKYNDERQS